jgi:hypothetical protein
LPILSARSPCSDWPKTICVRKGTLQNGRGNDKYLHYSRRHTQVV